MENPDNEKMCTQCEPTSNSDFRHHLTEMYGERRKINIDHLLNLNQFYLYNAMKKKIFAFNIREMHLETNENVNMNGTEIYSKLPTTTVSSNLLPLVEPTLLLSKINL